MTQARNHDSIAWFMVLCITLPWISPLVPGPSASVGPWLFSAVMASLFLLACALTSPQDRQAPHLADIASRAWLAAALVSVLIALVQYFGWASHFQGLVSQPYHHGQAFGNLRQRNQLASLMAIGLAALWLRKPGAGSLLCVAAFSMVCAATTSRAGLVQLVALLTMAFVWGRRANRPVLPSVLAAVAGYAIGVTLLPELLAFVSGLRPEDMLDRTTRSHCGARGPLWANVIHLISQKPWTGWGWGELDYAHYISVYPGPRFCDILDNAHNLPLHLAVELGIPLAVLICAALAWAVVRLAPWRETEPVRQMAWMVIVAIALHSMVEYPLWYGPFQMAMGLSVVLLWLTRPGRPASASSQRLYGVASSASLMLAATCYAAWDYGRVSQLYLPREQRSADLRNDTLAKVGETTLFRGHADFARLSTAARTKEDALANLELARRMLHFSPEPMVAEMEIESLLLLGRSDEAAQRMAHFNYVFPAEYALWRKKIGLP